MHLRWLPSDIGLMNSSVAKHPFLMKSAQAFRLRWLQRICLKKSHDIMLADRRVKIREIADIVDILHEKLAMRKLKSGEMGVAFAHSGAWQLRSTVWTCLSAIRKSFYGVSWRLPKHGSIITRQKWKNSQNSGLHPANVLQRRRKRFHRLERSWPPFFGIRKTSS